MISKYPIFIGFRGLTGFQRDLQDRGVTKTITTWFSLLRQGPGHVATKGVATGLVLAGDFYFTTELSLS